MVSERQHARVVDPFGGGQGVHRIAKPAGVRGRALARVWPAGKAVQEQEAIEGRADVAAGGIPRVGERRHVGGDQSGDGVQHLPVRRRRDVDSVVVGQSASGADLGRGAGQQGAVGQPPAGDGAEIVASVLAHHPGDVGDGLRLLVGQPPEVAAGEPTFHQRFGAGELAVEVQIEGPVAGQIGVHQRGRVAGRVRAPVAAIGNGAPSREVGVGADTTHASVGRLIHQVAGATAHRLSGEGAWARSALRQLEMLENRVSVGDRLVHVVGACGEELRESPFEKQALADHHLGRVWRRLGRRCVAGPRTHKTEHQQGTYRNRPTDRRRHRPPQNIQARAAASSLYPGPSPNSWRR